MPTAVATIMIAAPSHKVWQALLDPDMVTQFLPDTEVESEWKIGSSIIFRSEREGQLFEDRGMIVNMIPHELIEIHYLSSESGLPDLPENYKKMSYRLMPEDLGTQLLIIHEDIFDEGKKYQTQSYWMTALHKLKKLLES